MEGQYVTRKLHPNVLARVSKTASYQGPYARFHKILQCIQPDGQLYTKQFGIGISSQFIQLNARVLKAPTLIYSDEETFTPDQRCTWRMQQPTKKHFFQAATISRWIIVNMAPKRINDNLLGQFSMSLQETAHGMGMEMAPHMVLVRANFVNKQTLKNNVFERAKTMRPQLILFIIPELSECYGNIKTLGDLTYGIVTQCVLEKNIVKKFSNVAFLTNLLLKMNAKMNGINTVLGATWTQLKIMFVGIDVTHPSPGDGFSLSSASCVGSYDNTFARYTATLKVQERAKKELVELHTLMQQLLETYKRVNNYLPEMILIYRDGVSESQFDHVMAFEVTELKNLFDEMNYYPRLTYTVVQKRHNARFIPTRREDATGNGNVPAGTTVDTVITDPLKLDFLCSHDGSLGTSRPSRYWVLYDENDFTADDIQQITFTLCFLYPRCTRSISIPVPVQYAHLSAYRARYHIADTLGSQSMFPETGDEQLTSDQKKQVQEEHREKVNNIIRVNPALSNTLYYT